MSGHIADSSAVDWTTPKFIVDLVHEVLSGIDLDPCSNPHSIVGAKVEYLLPDKEGLVEGWQPELPGGGLVQSAFVNPPFGTCYRHKVTKEILVGKVYRKLLKEEQIRVEEWDRSTIAQWWKKAGYWGARYERGCMVLAPAAVGSQMWHKHVWPLASAVMFTRGRLKFGGNFGRGAGTSAPMDCALALFSRDPARAARFKELVEGQGLGVVVVR